MYALIPPSASGQNNRPTVPRLWLIVCIVLLALLSKIVNGQTIEEDYERRLLDTGVRYERLEIAYKKLEIAHDYQNKAYTALLEEYALHRMQSESKVQRMQTEGAAAIAQAGKVGFWRGAKWGGPAGVILYIAGRAAIKLIAAQ